MNYIRIAGTAEQLHNLPEVGEYELLEKSANLLSNDFWEVFAYADSEAITSFQSAGLGIMILIAEAHIDAQKVAMQEHLQNIGIA